MWPLFGALLLERHLSVICMISRSLSPPPLRRWTSVYQRSGVSQYFFCSAGSPFTLSLFCVCAFICLQLCACLGTTHHQHCYMFSLLGSLLLICSTEVSKRLSAELGVLYDIDNSRAVCLWGGGSSLIQDQLILKELKCQSILWCALISWTVFI